MNIPPGRGRGPSPDCERQAPVGRDSDEQLERWIHAAWEAIQAAATEHEQRMCFHAMCELIKQRSPQQIARMEREQGLR